jgi:uncharacterized DUF497 family protein
LRITYDPRKRADTLTHRELDFDDAPKVFASDVFENLVDRRDYGEVRWQTMGLLNGRVVMVVWTPRGRARHIISMWKCNDREQKRYFDRMGRS